MSGSMGNKIRHNSKAFTTCEQDRAAVKALLFLVLSKHDQPDKDKRLNMRKTNNNNISKVIEEYISSSPIRPVLIWFHSNQDIDNARRAISEINGCATCGQALYVDKAGAIQTLTPSGDDEQFIIPGTYNASTKFFLFHRYEEQLRGEYLKYALDLMYETKLPVVYLANDYSKEEEPQANVSAFEEWEYINE